MHFMKCSILISAICSEVVLTGVTDKKTWPAEDRLPVALSEGRNGVVVRMRVRWPYMPDYRR